MTTEVGYLRCYGTRDIEGWKREIEAQEKNFMMSRQMMLMSILSDVQELMSMGRTEEARQYINRVKFLLSERSA